MKAILNLADALPSIFTVSDILDNDYMENIMGVHYEKYKIFIRCIMNVDDKTMDSVEEIQCTFSDTRIDLIILLAKSKHKKFMKHFHEGNIIPSSKSKKEFYMGVSNQDKEVKIYIENVGFLKEDEIYESRLDTD